MQQARAQWKAMKTVEPLTLRADTVGGVTPSTGGISPAALRAAVNQSYKNAALAPLGQIPLNDLAKIGQRFLKAPQSSGTAERNLVGEAIKGPGALIGGALTAHEAGFNPIYGAATMAGTAAGNRMVQSLLRNPAIARQMVAAAQNPNGFRFTYPILQPPAAAAITTPFSLAPPSTSANSATR